MAYLHEGNTMQQNEKKKSKKNLNKIENSTFSYALRFLA